MEDRKDGGRPDRQEARARLSEYYGLQEAGDKFTTSATPSPEIISKQGNERAHSSKSGRRPSLRKPGGSGVVNPTDIDSTGFDPDVFVNKLVKEASLSKLMAQEGEIVRQIQGLDSDMQTLVYENYNKFIAATETIRKMRVDFKSMEEEMDQLAESMGSITSFSSQISEKLRTRRQEVAMLSSTHSTLQKLEFVLELPNRLNECIQEDQLSQAVEYWMRASSALEHYRDMPSFSGIQEDCEKIVCQLKLQLEQRLQDPNCTTDQLSEAVQLLRQLGTPADSLYDSYLAHNAARLTRLLAELEEQVEALTSGEVKHGSQSVAVMDPLEFVDHGCNGFLAELSLSINTFTQTFTNQHTQTLDPPPTEKLRVWVEKYLNLYLGVVERRLSLEKEEEAEVAILVRSLDRFHRRLTAAGRIIPGLDISRAGLDVVLSVCKSFCESVSSRLEKTVEENMTAARQQIAAPRRSGGDSPVLQLSELANTLLSSTAESLRSSFTLLFKFLDPQLSFSVKTYFRVSYSQEMVVKNVMMRHFWFTRNICEKFTGEVSVPPGLLLLLSRTCTDLYTSTTPYLAAMLRDQFQLVDHPDIAGINTALANTAQSLLDRYVQVQSGELSLMLRKSVEARDWLSTVEPRSVRAVMKRIVEDVTVIDSQVGQLYEEGQKKARSSDSSRRTGARSRSVFSSYGSRTLDSGLATNIQKLFSEKIDYFTQVRPAKVSVLSCIIKLGLKTLLECVRLKTFARFGLQQMQVDCHYLQLYLWRFVEDEAIVHHLLDEIMSSAIQRSLDQPPQLMEPSVVEVICDKV